MGIPAYFSHILKEHANILLSLQQIQENKQNQKPFDRLYMDCNSIVYEAYREILKENHDPSYQEIITEVINSIKDIIELIKPKKTAYVAFDGVAPFAKMKQQRLRRFRNEYFQYQESQPQKNFTSKFQTYMITPGTKFMQELSKELQNAFKHEKKIVLSTSNEPGEGEHKMMEHYRQNTTKKENVAIYGLDSDLIMLAIFHHHMANEVYIFREAPEFFKSKIPITFQHPKEPYFIDIKEFIRKLSIETNMNMDVYDYAFLCFLLGNDFLPHFPTLNLRTTGMQYIQDVYRIIPKKYKPIISPPSKKSNTWNIHWNHFYQFLFELSKLEHQAFTQEYEQRNRQERRYFMETTQEERETSYQHIPLQLRSKEMYIDPSQPGWENRYYKVLFPKNQDITQITKNYIEGLYWVFQYYTGGCKDWSWSYKYNYPPLLKDLLNGVPTNELILLDSNKEPFTPHQQLDFVLPAIAKYQEGMITKQEYEELIQKESKLELEWAFCKYMWESHLDM